MFNFIKRMEKKDIIFVTLLLSTVASALLVDIFKNNIQNTGQIILAMILISASIPFWNKLLDDLDKGNIHF